MYLAPPPLKLMISDDTDSEEEEGSPKKKANVDGKEVIDLLEGRWLQIEKFILTASD